MSDPIFVRTRHNYESYQDLWKLVELSGFPIRYVDEIDSQSDNTYLLMVRNGECGEGWKNARARIIHWNLEWEAYPPLAGIAETWASDRWFAGKIEAKYVPMGSHSGLKLDTPVAPDVPYHAAYIGYMVNRRLQLRAELTNKGLRLSPMHAWGADRHKALMQSACYVHVHQLADAPGMPPLRLVVAAAYSLPFITETIRDPGIFTPSYFMQSTYAQLADFVKIWACDEDRTHLNDYGFALNQLLCHDLTFRKSVERAV